MKIFLTSYGVDKAVADEIDDILGKKREDISFAIITDAKKYRPKEDFEASIDKNTQFLVDLGFTKYKHFSIQDSEKSELLEKLSKYDIIYIFGGNTFYLLNMIREHEFAESLRKLSKHKILIGQSAGSIIFSPSVEIAQNDFASDDNFIGMKDFSGLNFVDFALFPHFHESFKVNLKKLSESVDYKIYGIKDGQAIFVEDSNTRFIGGDPVVF